MQHINAFVLLGEISLTLIYNHSNNTVIKILSTTCPLNV